MKQDLNTLMDLIRTELRNKRYAHAAELLEQAAEIAKELAFEQEIFD